MADDSPTDLRIDFHHPYTPYDVQLQFMRTAYDVLQRGGGQVGILESPTGTGKSLSLICAALTWLRTFKQARFESSILEAAEEVKGEPEWLVESMLKRTRDELLSKWKRREERLDRARQQERVMEEREIKRRRVEKPSFTANESATDEEAEFLLDDIDSGSDTVLQDAASAKGNSLQDADDSMEDDVKIYYTSRTHSQLTQFISELRRPSFPVSVPAEVAQMNTGPDHADHEAIRHLPLSSRQKLCINPSVSRLSSLGAINDRCSELQQPKSKAKCPFIPRDENISQTHEFRDAALATLPDIEDLHDLGKSLRICPYYASRTAIAGAEIITLPYPLLLQKSARDALGIKLDGNVVIIDEAHNIMDAVANVHAAQIRLSDLRLARQMLAIYVKRFGKKLKGENRVLVAHLGKVIESLIEWMTACLKNTTPHGIVNSNSLLSARGADQINLYKLIQYIQDSKLAYKVESYASYIQDQENTGSGQSKRSAPVLHSLASFLASLTNLATEGRIFYEVVHNPDHGSQDVELSYLLLSPTNAFSSIATAARAIILAGGTMSPFDDYTHHLFPTHPPQAVTTLSCSHVIPASNLCVWTLASLRPAATAHGTASATAASGSDTFDFSFQRRGDKPMIRQLGVALLNLCTAVPDGVVVFFPSYGYLDEVVAVWQAPATDAGQSTGSLWERLQRKKMLFREQRGGSSDEILAQYSTVILGSDNHNEPSWAPVQPSGSPRGALLLSVVGGKMSEGINFSDRLGRCVVIVGLPYPNINSPEWKARMEYVESSTLARQADAAAGASSSGAGGEPSAPPREQALAQAKQAARDFYENACMRAVNQSIGRAIRHRGDYAAIVLADRRFGAQRIRQKLPAWIRGGMVEGSESKGLQGMMGALSGFFRGRQ